MAVGGHKDAKMTSHYKRRVDQAHLARSAMAKLSKDQFGKKTVQLENGLEEAGRKERNS
jgi:hypothetical protein